MNTNTDQFVMVDDNVGLTNRVEKQNIDTILTDTFKDIASVLMGHCGPYGQFAMLARTGAQVAEPVFTKDGIGIVRSMQYASPIQEFIRNTMAYMGSRIETAAGDGTTSSMVLLAKGIVKLREKLSHIRHRYTFSELQDAYDNFVSGLTKYIENNSFKAGVHLSQENGKLFVRNVAYSQAWTSTHGNKQLSEAIADLFADNPKEAWDYLSIEKSRIENDRPYFTEIDNSQYSIQDITIWPESAKTEDLGIARRREDTRTIISSVTPGQETYDGEQLLSMIDSALENKEQLTIICPHSIDSTTQATLSDKFRTHPDHDVCLFMIKDDDPRLNDITCMKVLANQMDILVERNLSYKYEKGDLIITGGLYDISETDIVNPYLGRDTHQALNDLVYHLDKIINQIKNEVSNRRLNEEVRRLKKFRLKLTVAKRSYFKIGGAAYDNAAAVDVVLDAILATKHTLEHGFGYGGNRMLYLALGEYKHVLSSSVKTAKTDIEAALVDTFVESIYELHSVMLSDLLLNPSEDGRIPSEYFSRSVDLTAIDQTDTLENNISKIGVGIRSLYDTDVCEHPVILQPIATDIEFIKRFGELALKFIYTNRIIVDGGMCRNEEQ